MSDLSSASTNEQEVSERPRWFPTSAASRCEKVPAEAREARVRQLREPGKSSGGRVGRLAERHERVERSAMQEGPPAAAEGGELEMSVQEHPLKKNDS